MFFLRKANEALVQGLMEVFSFDGLRQLLHGTQAPGVGNRNVCKWMSNLKDTVWILLGSCQITPLPACTWLLDLRWSKEQLELSWKINKGSWTLSLIKTALLLSIPHLTMTRTLGLFESIHEAVSFWMSRSWHDYPVLWTWTFSWLLGCAMPKCSSQSAKSLWRIDSACSIWVRVRSDRRFLPFGKKATTL